MNRRHIFIGDIHGCIDELMDLLDRINPSPQDVVVSVGDMVRKGPSSDRCLDLWQQRSYLAVLGNQEQRLLETSEGKRVPDPADLGVLERSDLLQFIRQWPLTLSFPDIGTIAVHGGLLPGVEGGRDGIDQQRPSVTTLRFIHRDGDRWVAAERMKGPGDRFWSEIWDGPGTVVYGHTPRYSVRRDPKAIGLDTGCVYGGRLSAAIHDSGGWRIVQVGARRPYAAQPFSRRLRWWLSRNSIS